MLHTAQLFTFVPPKQGGSSNAEAVANYLVSLIAFVALGLAVYIWYYYQPMLNTGKYAEAHCDGMFDGSTASSDGDGNLAAGEQSAGGAGSNGNTNGDGGGGGSRLSRSRGDLDGTSKDAFNIGTGEL